MGNFFNKVDKANIDAAYHNPYKFLSAEHNTAVGKAKKMGDFETTLWMETAGLTVCMSLIILVPMSFKFLG